MGWLKQLFCKHIYRLENKTYLYTSTRFIDGVEIDRTHHYAEKYICVRCEKTKLEETVFYVKLDKQTEK